jgi:hypothetical protein
MAKPIVFDPSPYLRPPKLDVRQAVALAIALLSALPKSPTDGMKRTARAMRKATITMKKAWAQKRRVQGTSKPADKVKADRRIDTAWAALKMRIDACAFLPIEAHPMAPRAGEISQMLFPKGLEFLTLVMDKEWAESNQLLERIEDEGLAAELDAIAGPAFLAEIRAAQVAYGEALGITKAHEAPAETETLLEPLRELVSAIGDYLLQVVASVDREEAATIRAARAALVPLDRFREGAARRAGSKDGKEEASEPGEDLPEVDPETPVPDVPQ